MTRRSAPATAALPEVHFSDHGRVRYLHLGTEWVQGSMRLDAPDEIDLDYVQRMMAWLLFVDAGSVPARHAMQLGLGAGSLTKHCAKVLCLQQTTAIELNPQVLAACRGWFKLPADSSRLRVVLADAAQEIQPHWWGTIDALQVDLYDQEAAAPVLDSPDFYAACRRLLSEQGCMTVNLFGRSSSFTRSVARISAAFGQEAVWAFKATREGNTVVLAQRLAARPQRALLARRADIIQSRWQLIAGKWISGLQAIV